MLSLLPLLAIGLLSNGMPFYCTSHTPFHREAQNAAVIAIVEYDPTDKGHNDKEIVFLIQKLLKAPADQQQLKKIARPRPDGWKAVNNKKYLIFSDIKDNKTDPYLTIECSDELHSYMEGLLKCSDTQTLLRFVFPYLRSTDSEVARDSYWTIKQQPDKELLNARSVFDADKLRAWLKIKTDDHWKTSLYAYLLGYSGTASDIPLLKQLLEHQANQGQHIDEILFAIIQLDSKQGWEIAAQLSESNDSFFRRWGVYRALYLTYENDREKPGEKTLHHILDQGLAQDDFADLTIHFIRNAKLWAYTPRILKLYKESNGIPIINRAVIRMALQSPDPAAKPFLAQLRKVDPERVKDCEEINKLEKNEQEKQNPRK